MRLVIAALTALLLNAGAISAERQCPRQVPQAVEARLAPVLKALDRARKRNDIWDKELEQAIANLSRAQDRASSEARVALMDYYIGEAYGEGLVCAVALDSARTRELLERYEDCDIAPRYSPVERFHGSGLRSQALKLISEGAANTSCGTLE